MAVANRTYSVASQSIEVRRLLREVFRRVPIPYYGLFADLDGPNIWDIVKYGLGRDSVARRHTVKTRLESSPLAVWRCPKGTKNSARGARVNNRVDPSRDMVAPLHQQTRSGPGVCQERDPATGRPCGALLRPQETHLHEFAAAFGILEESNDNFIRGKFGLVSEYVASMSAASGYFDQTRAIHALLLYSLLERHGDCALPALYVIRSGTKSRQETFLSMIRTNLLTKYVRHRESTLPRNLAYHAVTTELNRYLVEWGVEEHSSLTNSVRPKTRTSATGPALKAKTLESYLPRTMSYLQDLGLTRREQGPSSPVVLTEDGMRLCDVLESYGFLSSPRLTELPPSFETMHDAFAIEPSRYTETVSPAVTHGTLEAIVGTTVLPGKPLTLWSSIQPELVDAYTSIVDALSDSMVHAARLDAVRLALFIHGVGTARRLQLDSTEAGEPTANIADHAAVEIALSNPQQYLLGHARSGRRFWTVALARR